jgi:hypothetical protein
VVIAVYVILLEAALPAAMAWAARKTLAPRSKFAGVSIIVGAAAIPALWGFYATRDADVITRAAGLYVAPGMFAFSLYFSFMGYRLARPKQN